MRTIRFAAKTLPGSLSKRLERALVLAAYLVVIHGPEFAPCVECLKKALEEERTRGDAVAEARRILEDYQRIGFIALETSAQPTKDAT